MVIPRDASWYREEPAPYMGRNRRWMLWLSVVVLVAGVATFVAILHLAPSIGAAGGCGGG